MNGFSDNPFIDSEYGFTPGRCAVTQHYKATIAVFTKNVYTKKCKTVFVVKKLRENMESAPGVAVASGALLLSWNLIISWAE